MLPTYLPTELPTYLPFLLPTDGKTLKSRPLPLRAMASRSRRVPQVSFLPSAAPWKLRPLEKKESHWNSTNPPPPNTHTTCPSFQHPPSGVLSEDVAFSIVIFLCVFILIFILFLFVFFFLKDRRANRANNRSCSREGKSRFFSLLTSIHAKGKDARSKMTCRRSAPPKSDSNHLH